MQPSSNILALTGISKAFAGVKALDRVNFDLRPGEVHALVGENGAGKSTLMKVLTGVYQRDAGQIAIEGRPVEIRDVHHARQLGVAIIFQELSQVPQLTVAQNIFLGEEPRRFLGVLNDRRMTARAADLLHTYQIHLDPSEQLSGLSVAERQLAEIAKAISLGARILIMDEPTSALTLGETENLFKIVNHLRQQGVGIIYISHRMNEIARLADRVTVLRDGKNVGTFDAAAISSDEIVRLMVGREVEAVDAATHQRDAWRRWATEEPALDVCGLSRKGVLSDITFSLRRGEILGLAGLVGSGRSEVARAIFGIDPIDQGEIRMGGKPVRIRNAGDAMAAGMALLPEDRRQQGLITRHTVEQNLMLPILPAYTRHGMVNGGACRRAAQKAIEHLQIRPSDPDLHRPVPQRRQSAEGRPGQVAGRKSAVVHYG